MDYSAEKTLHGVIEIKEGPGTERTMRKLEQRFRQLEGGGGPGGTGRGPTAAVAAQKQRTTAVRNYNRQIEHTKRLINEINRGWRNQWVLTRSVSRTVASIKQLEKAIVLEAAKGINADKGRIQLLRMRVRLNDKILQQQAKQRQAGGGMFGMLKGGVAGLRNFAMGLLRIYWISISAFYAIRNLTQAITGGFQIVLQLGQRVVGVFAAITKQLIEASSELEGLTARMNVMFRERAPMMIKWVMEEAIGLPFEWKELAAGAIRATVMGVRDPTVLRQVMKTGEDMAVAFGKPMERAVHAIMQGAVGRFRSLIESFGFRPEVAVQYGAAPAERGRGVSGAPENLQRNIQAIIRMVTDRVGGAAEAMKGTWSALVEDMKDMWARFVQDIKEVILEPFKVLLVSLREMFLVKGGGVQPWVKSLQGSIIKLMEIVKNIMQWLVPNLPQIIGTITVIIALLVDKFTRWYEGAGGIVGILGSIRDWFFKWGPTVLGTLSIIAEHIGRFVFIAGFAGRKAAIAGLRAGGRAVLEDVGLVEHGERYGIPSARISEMRGAQNQAARALGSMLYDVVMEQIARGRIIGGVGVETARQLAAGKGLMADPEMIKIFAEWDDAIERHRRTLEEINAWDKRLLGVQRRTQTLIVSPLEDATRAIRDMQAAYEGAAATAGADTWIAVLKTIWPELAEEYQKISAKMPKGLTYQKGFAMLGDVLKLLPPKVDATGDAFGRMTDTLDEGVSKITATFDILRFIGYTRLAAGRGYGTAAAMGMAQQRVLGEMGVRAGTAGAAIPQWPWAGQGRGGPPEQKTEWGPGYGPGGVGYGPGSWQNVYGAGVVAAFPELDLMSRKMQSR